MLLWQVVAIVPWTGAVVAAATGLVAGAGLVWVAPVPR
ncbi:hypothetical protein Q760_00375 [Cellulomonas cellasea DSM 20118]|uniref:Uncharacterized protein n=1 Tax=Cellulomonas cellasea DSM 20118 TaxID=1408250 RepID=A0A0A0BBR7_9CELL|nr:hypothetical protein Q760_00375 [Cellulomonas cellasea DSM 20118]